MVFEGYCGNCSHGEVQGMSVRCTKILQDCTIFLEGNKALLDHELSHVLVPLTFSCIDYETKPSMGEEEIG